MGYGDMLFKIGIELPGPSDNPQFMETTDPRTYPGFETQLKVSKYVVEFDPDQARDVAICFKDWLDHRLDADDQAQ